MTTAGQLTESSAAAGIRGGAVTDEANRRTELGRFLRTRRERIDPMHAGFPLVGRRRTSGLRREEVAVLAGVSTTWYTYLEQGRNKNVSKAVLNSVAGVLQLSDDEIRYMHFLAYGQMHDEVVTDLMSLSATDLLSKVVATADRHPYPVYVVDHRCDLIAWNPAATEWYDDWAKLPPENRNFLHWLFMSPRARQSIVSWTDFAGDITARWRLEIARWPGDKIIEQRIRDLSLESPEFVRFWDEYGVSEHHANIRRLRHPELGEKALLIFPLRTPYVSVPGIIYHFPALPYSAARAEPVLAAQERAGTRLLARDRRAALPGRLRTALAGTERRVHELPRAAKLSLATGQTGSGWTDR
jgi:transcriptional regulator with XRE-family HTH domain